MKNRQNFFKKVLQKLDFMRGLWYNLPMKNDTSTVIISKTEQIRDMPDSHPSENLRILNPFCP